MYSIKRVAESTDKILLYQSTWLIEKTVMFNELTITKGAALIAPQGKYVTLTVNGVGKDLAPGFYKGEVALCVTENTFMKHHGLMRFNEISRNLHTAISVKDAKVEESKCIPALINGGKVSDGKTEGVYIASEEESFNGIVISGEGKYNVQGVKIDFEGDGDNDFLGVGAGIAVIDTADVMIDGCNIALSGITRCAVHVGGDSNVTVRNCEFSNYSANTDYIGEFSWQVGFSGTNRLTQLTDNATVRYENCRLKTNGWGICSIDGSEYGVKMYIKDSYLELSGPRAHGYGAFCIGENEVVFDNSTVDVNGYPMLLMGMDGLGRAKIINGSVIKGRRFGAMVVGDDNSVFEISDSEFDTIKSSIVVKGSSTVINIRNTSFKAENGTILQLMDTDECGMDSTDFKVPVGETDTAIDGRSLAEISETEDISLNISDCTIKGNFFNSTTNTRAHERSGHGPMGEFHDNAIGHLPPHPDGPSPVQMRHNGNDLRGPFNLGLFLKNTSIEGIISSAVQAYRDGVTIITKEDRLELSNITQTAAKTVNNGVVVTLDEASSWIVADTCYITSLTIAKGAAVKAPEGKKLSMTIDGKKTPVAEGEFKGKIKMLVE